MEVKNGIIYIKGGAFVAALIVKQFDKVGFVQHFLPQFKGQTTEKELIAVYKQAEKMQNDNGSGQVKTAEKLKPAKARKSSIK